MTDCNNCPFLSATDVANYREQGFLLLSNFFDRGTIEQVRQDAIRLFQKQLGAQAGSEQEFEQGMFRLFQRDLGLLTNCGKHIQHAISLHRLGLREELVGVLRELGLAEPNICTRPVLFFNSRHLAAREVYWRVFAHQDWRSMQGSLNAAVVWVPLHDIDIELGALEIVPGSHRRGLIATEVVERFGKVDEFGDECFQPVEVRQGDALFFSAFLVHRSGTNSTENIRWSCHFRYNDLAEPTFIARGYPHPYVYHPVDELLTPDFPRAEQVQAAIDDSITRRAA